MTMDWLGKKIEHYQILSPLGKGGMGEVYLAQDTILDRKVAIKFLPKEIQDDAIHRERFFREAKAAAALDHPFICKIYQTGELKGKSFIVMEYIEGNNLQEKMREDRISLKESLRVLLEITEALEKAHENGIVHRDLKPANIMITPEGHIKIMDFGLAKKVFPDRDSAMTRTKRAAAAPQEQPVEIDHEDKDKTVIMDPGKGQISETLGDVDSEKTVIVGSDAELISDQIWSIESSRLEMEELLTQQGTLVGTLNFMSPEQARGEEVDRRSDIFSLGIIFYEMIAKRHPFSRKTTQETLKAILLDPPPALSIKPKKLNSALIPIIKKALAKDVKKRYQTVTELAKDIQKMQKVLHIGSPLFYLSKNKPVMAALIATLALIVAGTFWFARRGRVSAALLEREPVSVLVADFQNRTGDSVFDSTLEQALNIGLEGASFISIYQRPEARKIALEVNPDSGGRLDSQMTQLITVREGIGKFIDGSIEPRGDGYTLKVWVRDPVNAEDVKEFSRNVKSRDEVLNAAAWLANKVRSSMGDVSADAKKAFQGETFTTSSLVAMNAYTNAQELYRQGKDEESVSEYLRAIKEDPDFGRAYATLALVYQNRGQYKEAERNFQEALSRIDRMSDREKLRTRAVYYLINRNFQQAIKECEEWVMSFPADVNGFSNLALANFYARNFEVAKEKGQKAVELNPRKIQTRFNLSWYALAASDFEVAAQEAQSIIEESPNFYEVYVVLALSDLAMGKVNESIRLYEEMQKINPIGESLAALGLADIALYEGRFSDAINILEERLESDKKESRTHYAGNKLSMLAHSLLLAKKTARAVQVADQAVESGNDLATMFMSAQVYVRASEMVKASLIIEELSKRLEPEPKAYAKLIEGEIKQEQGEIQEAILLFQEAQTILDTWLGRFILGKAFLEIESYPEAYSALDSCIRQSGEAASVFFDDTPTYHVVAPIYYYLGRAQEGLGSPASKDSYQKFLDIRQKADQEDPLIKDARDRIGPR